MKRFISCLIVVIPVIAWGADKSSDQDEAAFEAYRAKVEAYEIPYLQQKNNAAQLDRDILRNDPVDNPPVKDIPSQRPDLNSPSTNTPPRP